MGTGVVPSATDYNPHLPYIRTTEECGGLVACPWYLIVELQLHQSNAMDISCTISCVYTIPINVLTCDDKLFYLLFRWLRGVTAE